MFSPAARSGVRRAGSDFTVFELILTLIGFLHTSTVHVRTFDALLYDVAPGATGAHVVDEQLLARARSMGADDALRVILLDRLRELTERRADVNRCRPTTARTLYPRIVGDAGAAGAAIERQA